MKVSPEEAAIRLERKTLQAADGLIPGIQAADAGVCS
jgi:hypothetical protein